MTTDAIELAQKLIQCPSVTPAEGGALDLLEKTLGALGFECHRLVFEEDGTDPVDNLYARIGTTAPHFCFAGHTDVVPVGDADAWSFEPFSGDITNGWLRGRGASDMKGAVAAFVDAAASYLSEQADGLPRGSISLLITGDEEGPAINGTRKVLEWLEQRDEVIDFCLVGEPTNPEKLGDMVKIGRRGTVAGKLTVKGTQGHVAYPERADNPMPRLIALLDALMALKLDDGTELFQPSNIEVTTIDVGNPASNVIPSSGTACFNVRFNDSYSGATLEQKIRQTLDSVTDLYQLDFTVNGEPFYTQPGALSDLVSNAVEKVTGRTPELSTSGGTSDARFIRAFCPVVEFGITGQTMHKVDEQVLVSEMEELTTIYRDILDNYLT